ncbi:MAG: hypothetical protein AB7R89_25865 [Dehalococcoidia bacterium]
MLFFAILFGILGGLIAPFAVRAWRSRSVAPFKEAGWGAFAGAGAGLVWGVGARLAMRIVAISEGSPTEFSIGGTAFILLTGMVFGLLLGLLFAAVRGWLPGSGIGKGVAFGSILALLLLLPIAAVGMDDLVGGSTEAPELIGAGLFCGLFVLHGAVMGAIIRRRRPSASVRTPLSSLPSPVGGVAEPSGLQT